MENSKHYRVRTSIDDKVLPLNLNQDIDFLDVLSIKIGTKDAYRLHGSNYGVLVGRVLANDAFGIPNAKVSIFFPRDNGDGVDTEINNIYPFTSVFTQDRAGVRYNLLDERTDDECHQDVGTFPSKRRVLDNGDVLYVYDKYLKYTTVTNASGDYMIYGVPTGNQQLHVDIDLSDIGILSQKPRDMVANGHVITEFENPNQFKASSNLGSLAQIITEDKNVYIYSFWGDESHTKVSVSRNDIHVNYKFEPTCVFMGSIVTDNEKHSISNRCRPNRKSGYNRNLVTSSGTIEMIRKTPGGYVEEHQIQGTQLINGDGVWCYQIPMNLDYVGTDEYGNIVPTDNPNKGIPTRTRVRFRMSINENGEEGISRHRAKMLVPNIAQLDSGSTTPNTNDNLDELYIFGSDTPESQFRDLYWNKVYTVKSYIPRLQTAKNFSNYDKFIGIKKTNDEDGKNPIPFNSLRVRTPFMFSLICRLSSIVAFVVESINIALTLIPGVVCVSMSGISDDGTIYAPGCSLHKKRTAKKLGVPKSKINGKLSDAVDAIQTNLADDADVVNLDFVNDWLNGCMYMPLFHYKGSRKWKIFGIPFSHTSKKRFCSCDREVKRMRLYENCSMGYTSADINYQLRGQVENRKDDEAAEEKEYVDIKHGVIKEFLNNDNVEIYYYAHGVKDSNQFFRLYSNDIVLLGSFNECDMDGMPQLFKYIPVTTANIPEIEGEIDDETGEVENSGMDWGSHKDYRGGLFTNIKCGSVDTLAKSCVNARRMCELGVDYDMSGNETVVEDGMEYDVHINVAGGITSKDLTGTDARSMFATMNSNKLIGTERDEMTGYEKYGFSYVYTYDFDGLLSSAKGVYSDDLKDKSYIKFRFGDKPHFYKKTKGVYRFPLFENSFYFYFGLNHGKTAMDIFHENYYSKCVKPSGDGMSVAVTTKNAKLCVDGDQDLGSITVNVSNVQMPCDCKLIANGDYINSVDDFTGKEIKFEGLVNNTYAIEVTDVNGKISTYTATLSSGEFGAVVSARDLGRKYKEGEVIDYSQWDKDGTYGLIEIASVLCDGNQYDVNKDTVEQGQKTDKEASFSYKLGNSELSIKLILEEGTWEDFTDTQKEILVEDKISIAFYKPAKVIVKTMAICGHSEEDPYEKSQTIVIENGEDFRCEMNGMPVEFMSGKWYGGDVNIMDNLPECWAMPDDPNSYADDFNAGYKDEQWDKYIEGLETDDDNARRNKVVEYKLNRLMSMANGIMSSDDGAPHKPSLRTIGGNDTIVRYSGPNLAAYDEYNKVNEVIAGTKSSADTYPDTPMLVINKDGLSFTNNYTNFQDSRNQLYYFAGFTNNGDGEAIPSEALDMGSIKPNATKVLDSTPEYVKNGYIAMPNIDRRFQIKDGGWVVFPVDNDSINGVVTENTDNYSGNMLIPITVGVKMAFSTEEDNKYSLIGEGLEWSYDNNGVVSKTDKKDNEKLFYSIECNDTPLDADSIGYDGENYNYNVVIPKLLMWDKRVDEEFRFDATACSYNINAFIANDGNGDTVQAYAMPGDSVSIELPMNRNVVDFMLDAEDDCNCVYNYANGKATEDKEKRKVRIRLSDSGILCDRICKPMLLPYDGGLFNNIMTRFDSNEVLSDGSAKGSGFINLGGIDATDNDSGFRDQWIDEGNPISNIAYCTYNLTQLPEGYYADSGGNSYNEPIDEITLTDYIEWVADTTNSNGVVGASKKGATNKVSVKTTSKIKDAELQVILIQKIYFVDNDNTKRFKTYNMSTILDFRGIDIAKERNKFILKEDGTENKTLLTQTDNAYVEVEGNFYPAKTEYKPGSGLYITPSNRVAGSINSIYLQTSAGMRYKIEITED